jgi:hypothetical protein
MYLRTTWLACALVVSLGGVAAFSLPQPQEPIVQPAAQPSAPPASVSRDLSKLNSLQQQMLLCAQRAGDWLRRVNRPDGRFIAGYVPALKVPLEGDYYLRQAGAALALARVARFLGDERYAAVARQAILTLLVDTATDPSDPDCRRTTLPPLVVNRLASAGLLIAGIHELPSPGEDLLQQAEQLCGFVRKQQQNDGSLRIVDNGSADAEPDSIDLYPGMALYGLIRSHELRPAAWKIDVVRKALPYYDGWWRTHQTMSFVPSHTTAFAEAFRSSKEPIFADFVFRMNDWLCDLQYTQLDPRHPLWTGGFMEWTDGKPNLAAPHAVSAAYAESLAEACRVAHQAGDVQRRQRYRESLERALQFLNTLQYTDANTQHFADWYRPMLVGAFYTSHQSGDIRIDYTQHAACALVQYVRYSGEW